MIFQSIEFILFFSAVCIGYYLLPRICRKYWLLAASWAFYLTYTPTFAWYLGGVTLFSYLMGLATEKVRNSSLRARRAVTAVGLIGTFAPLVVMKYANFALINVGAVLGVSFTLLKLAVPLGLSFFSFQAAGYLIDVYRGKRAAERNLFSYSLFLSFFPTIVSGPIERSTGFLQQIDAMPQRRIDTWKIRHGLLTMIYGFFLKMVVADRLSIIVNTIFGAHIQYGGFVLVLAIIAFGLQLYCDFAGVSTIALGAGEVLGFSLTDNFACPYFSRSISEFWRRWHISLSSWFRDYLYIPLGGNRKGTLRKYINTMIVFIVSGVWHGAGWNYVVWGGLNGFYIVMGGVLKPLRERLCQRLHIDRKSTWCNALRVVFNFGLVSFAWLFFRAQGMRHALSIGKRILLYPMPAQLFNGTLLQLGLDGPDLIVLAVSLVIVLLVSLASFRGVDWKERLLRQRFPVRLAAYMLLFLTMLLFAMYGPSFNASSFIYADF